MNHLTASTAAENGASTAQELLALTDEQILEIETHSEEPGEGAKEQSSKADPSTSPAKAAGFARDDKIGNGSSASAQPARAGVPALQEQTLKPEPPAWLARQMKDPWVGEEALELWDGVLRAQAEAAEYRAAIASPAEARSLKEIYPGGIEQAKVAAERARTLDEFDAAYFGAAGKSTEEISAARTALALRMLKEDPAAFQEMLAAGVRALTEASKEGNSIASTRDAAEAKKRDGLKSAPTEQSSNLNAVNEAQVRAYGDFEKTANAELEKNVGGAIERALQQALPHAGRSDSDGLKTRLAAGVRQEIEKALQGDRQLGEQVAQILSARRFDDASRAQVVRLIGERAGQLVPGATKRVLNDWTQTTLAAHRSRTDKQEAENARVDLVPAQQGREISRLQAGKSGLTSAPIDPTQGRRNDSAGGRSGRIDYKKLSDEQIVEL